MDQKRFLVALRITTFLALCIGILGVFSGCGAEPHDGWKKTGDTARNSEEMAVLTGSFDRNPSGPARAPLAPFRPLH